MEKCYIIKKEKGKVDEIPLREFLNYLVKNEGLKENTVPYFIFFPEELVYVLNSVEKKRGREYKMKYK